MNAAQCRGARAMLRWPAKEVALRSGFSVWTINEFENGHTPKASTIAAIREAFEGAGVTFTEKGISL